MSGQPVTGIGDGASGSGLTATLLVKRRSVWVDIWVDERFVRTVPVPVEISVVAPAYVALRDLPAGEAIDARPVVADQFAVQDVEWSGRNTLPVSVAAEFGVGEFRLTHSLSPGQALTRADIAHVPLVLRGDMVTLRAHEGGISLESRVEALQDGDAGKAVRVKLSDASTSIVAYVIGPGLVELRR
jgi:flagella basal body P-ring formation protein FlgA